MMLLLTMAVTVSAEEVKNGTLTGKWITKQSGPMAQGFVYLFNTASGPPPSPNRYWRIPDEIVDVDKDGRFSAGLLPGKYYLGMVKRVTGKGIGPPADGDFYFFSSENGRPKVHTVSRKKITDIGTVSEAEVFKLEQAPGVTAIEGIVTDVDGKPVPGMLVFAFLTPAMVGRPMFVSDRTGADGKYLLRVKDGGSYYLKVREEYGGGQPIAGEMVGGYLDKTPIAVKVKRATITKSVDLKATRFVGRGPKRNEKK